MLFKKVGKSRYNFKIKKANLHVFKNLLLLPE
jgi:hypothetical protein